jgi:hypothetical protein
MWLLRIGLVVAAITAAPQSDTPAPPDKASEEYFQRALTLIRQHHRNSSKADWAQLIARARPMLAGASHPADTYPAIRMVLSILGEHHSFLLPPPASPPLQGTSASSTAAASGAATSPAWHIIAGNIGAVRLPALNTLGPDGPALGKAYATAIQTALSEIDKNPRLCGWIIDLRDNGGGNMWPMLKGLDPLLGTGPFGYFVQTDGSTQAWQRSAGNIFPAPEMLPPSSPAFALKHASTPIAVLIGPQTASSGEMVAIALIGRQGVRTFGTASAGFTSGNNVYPLTDGATLVITEVSVRDRTGKGYAGPIVPDEQVTPAQIEAAASRWLARQCEPAGTP